ncbi:MAG: (Fe-S)-binding protein [Anaerolineaceae bacterium]|nr:(Fe-S)-binding protein [Anaerolineaceae bacterium]
MASNGKVRETALNTYIKEVGGAVAAQLEACTRCGICAEACHFYLATGKPEYTPIWKVELVKRLYEQRFTPMGRLKLALGLDKPVTEADLEQWVEYDYHACTMCQRCSLVCPMGIQIGDLIHMARSGLQAAGLTPEDLQQALDNQLELGSPLGVDDDTFDDRMEWVEEDWEVDLPMDKAGADNLLVFSSIEIMKFPDNIAAIAKILDAGGVNWTISKEAREVTNFGLYAGSDELEAFIVRRIVEPAKRMKVKRVIVSECGHAYDNLRFRAANLLGETLPFEIVHITEVIGELLASGKIKVKPGVIDEKVTFHDACKIQRRGGNFDQPREVLKQLAGKNFVEMTPNREAAFCCGGGGGVIATKAADTVRRAAFTIKIDQVNQTGAHKVAMTCSNCRLQFLDCVDHFALDWEVLGIAQLVADNLVK